MINGGPCLTATTAAAAPGDAFFLATTKIQVVLNTEVGTDTIAVHRRRHGGDAGGREPAAADHRLGQRPGARRQQRRGRDHLQQRAERRRRSTAPRSLTSNTSGGKTVSTLPALHALLGMDLTTQSTLSCQ